MGFFFGCLSHIEKELMSHSHVMMNIFIYNQYT